MEEFCCLRFLLSHLERTQECLNVCPTFPIKLRYFCPYCGASGGGQCGKKTTLQNKLCQKLLLWKKETFSQSNCFATLRATVFVSISYSSFTSLLCLALSHMHKVQMEKPSLEFNVIWLDDTLLACSYVCLMSLVSTVARV